MLFDPHVILDLENAPLIGGTAAAAAVTHQRQQHGKITVTGDLLPAGLTAGGDIRREGHFAGILHRQAHRGGEHAAAPGHRQLRGLAVPGHRQRHLRVRRPAAEGDAHVGLQRMAFRVKAGGFKGKIRQILRLLPLLCGQVRDPLIHIGKPICDIVQFAFQDRLLIHQLRPDCKQSDQQHRIQCQREVLKPFFLHKAAPFTQSTFPLQRLCLQCLFSFRRPVSAGPPPAPE